MADLATQDFRKRMIKRISIILIMFFIVSFAVLSALINNGISMFAISGNSMEPTFYNRDSVIIQQSKNLQKDDFIFFKKPPAWDDYIDTDTTLVKRIIAVPGDTLAYDGESFYVNDKIVYSLTDDNYSCANGEVGYEHELTNTEIFVMGDNANYSLDSRKIFCDGNADAMFIPKKSVVDYGKVIARF